MLRKILPKISVPSKKRKLEDLVIESNSNNNIIENKIITLKYTRRGDLIWIGSSNKKENINENPLILKFNDKDFYFYSTEIKISSAYKKYSWISYRNNLDSGQQEKVFEAFAKYINQKDLYQQGLLLSLKVIFLTTSLKSLDEKRGFFDQEIINFEKKIFSTRKSVFVLNKEIRDFVDKNIGTNDINNKMSIKFKIVENLKQIVKNEDKKIEELRKELDDLFNKFKLLEEDNQNSQLVPFNSKDQSNFENILVIPYSYIIASTSNYPFNNELQDNQQEPNFEENPLVQKELLNFNNSSIDKSVENNKEKSDSVLEVLNEFLEENLNLDFSIDDVDKLLEEDLILE